MAKNLHALVVFIRKNWGLMWRFLLVIGVIGVLLKNTEISERRFSLPTPSELTVAIADISDQLGEVEKLSTRALFFGPSDEKPPKDLQLKEWDEMQYMEPSFIFE